MTKVKIQKIMSKDSAVDQELLLSMFEQMTGVRDADIDIIIPKYVYTMALLKKFHKLYSILINIDVFTKTFSQFVWVDEIKKFLQEMITQCGLNLEHNYSEQGLKKELYERFYRAPSSSQAAPTAATSPNKKNTTDAASEHVESSATEQIAPDAEARAKEHMNSLYRTVKQSQVIKHIMVTSSNLKFCSAHLAVSGDINDRFITLYPGSTFTPIAFTGLDLKLIWDYDVESQCKKFLLNVLQHTFKISYEIYDIMYSPDVDIVKFSDLLISTITTLRSRVPRCDKAFDVIEKSVNLLRSNFKDYFRLSVESKNPATILESFIIDVSNTQKANPLVVMQFRKIVAFMQKHAANINDPRIKQLFAMVNSQFSQIDSQMQVNTNIPDEET